jgi:hypothetical protein
MSSPLEILRPVYTFGGMTDAKGLKELSQILSSIIADLRVPILKQINVKVTQK